MSKQTSSRNPLSGVTGTVTRLLIVGIFSLARLGPGAGAVTSVGVASFVPFRFSDHRNAFTPSAIVPSRVSPSREDISDHLRQSSNSPTTWFWVGVAAGVLFLLSAAGVAWQWIRTGKFFTMQPEEIALQHLAEAWQLMEPGQSRKYCFALARIVRRYLEDRFKFYVPQLATEEFLRRAMKPRGLLPDQQRGLLTDFIEHFDRAKLADWNCCRPDLESMHASAEKFITHARPDPDRVPWTRSATGFGADDDLSTRNLARTTAPESQNAV